MVDPWFKASLFPMVFIGVFDPRCPARARVAPPADSLGGSSPPLPDVAGSRQPSMKTYDLLGNQWLVVSMVNG